MKVVNFAVTLSGSVPPTSRATSSSGWVHRHWSSVMISSEPGAQPLVSAWSQGPVGPVSSSEPRDSAVVVSVVSVVSVCSRSRARSDLPGPSSLRSTNVPAAKPAARAARMARAASAFFMKG